MISSVSALVPVSIPLFTNISKGGFTTSRLGRNFVSSSLSKVVHIRARKMDAKKRVPESLRGYGE